MPRYSQTSPATVDAAGLLEEGEAQREWARSRGEVGVEKVGEENSCLGEEVEWRGQLPPLAPILGHAARAETRGIFSPTTAVMPGDETEERERERERDWVTELIYHFENGPDLHIY